ncbi:MAG: hypothetical protein ABSG68_20540 [Thermoguttaceae bacterium]|jgi:hypothetical protein
MKPILEPRQYDLYSQLYKTSDGRSTPVWVEDVTADVRELMLETYMHGVLAEQLPPSADLSLEARFRPRWLRREPLVESIEIQLQPSDGGPTCSRTFRNGRWVRRAEVRAEQLRTEGHLTQEEPIYQMLTAVPVNGRSGELQPPVFEVPPIDDQTWEELGLRGLGAGALRPARPIVVNSRMEADVAARTREAGILETGGACLGRYVRLPEPLPGATTRIVTVLAASVCDARHEGSPARWKISPDAMAEAAQLAEISGRRVMTVWHSHGFCDKTCAKDAAQCPLVGPSVFSIHDYDVAERLLPSKATVMPICGRAPGQPEPVLVVHGWEDGMRPIPWMRYDD